MSNLNVNAQEGRLVEATQTPIAANMGNKVVSPIETAKMDRGTMGDFSGELEAARTQAETAKQLSNVINDSATRMLNLQMAEEESKKSLYELDWHTRERDARNTAREIAVKDGLDTDGEQAVYQMERDKQTDELKDKYSFVTKVGNDIEQRAQLWTDRANTDYMDTVVEPRRVDAVKGNMVRSIQEWSKNTVDQVAQETDAAKSAKLIQSTTARIQEYVRSPQMVAVFGQAATEDMAIKAIREMQVDTTAVMTNKDPESAVAFLRNETGDPETDVLYGMDPSTRRQALYQAEKENSTRIAEKNRQIKETQDKNEFEMSYKISTGQMSGPAATAEIYKARNAGLIDQSHAERLIDKNEARAERMERRAEAAAARQDKKEEKQRAILQPVNDAIETGMQLDPKNPSHVKSVNAYASAVMAKNPGKETEVLLKITQQTGVAPKVLSSQVYGLINSKDPKQAVQGTQLLASIAETAPGIVHSMTDETISKAHQIELGIHPDQAQLNIERVRSLTKEQQADYKKLADSKADKITSSLKDTFNISSKDITPEAHGAYRDLLKDQLVMTGGNMDAALTATNSIMRKSYGVSYLTGKPTLMFNAPEGTNGKTDWMTQQLKDDLSELNLKPEQVQLRANHEGTYDLIALDDKGVAKGYLTDPATGHRQTWKPDQESVMKKQREALAEEIKKQNDAQAIEAEQRRAAYLKHAKDIADTQAVVSSAWKPKQTNNTNDIQTAFGRFRNGKQ